MRGGGWWHISAVIGSLLLAACGSSSTGPGGGSGIPAFDGTWDATLYQAVRVAAPHDSVDLLAAPWNGQYRLTIDSVAGTAVQVTQWSGTGPVTSPAIPIRLTNDTLWGIGQGGAPDLVWMTRAGRHLVWVADGHMPDAGQGLAVVTIELTHR